MQLTVGMKITVNLMTWHGKMLTYDSALLKFQLHDGDDDFTSVDVMSIGVYIVIKPIQHEDIEINDEWNEVIHEPRGPHPWM